VGTSTVTMTDAHHLSSSMTFTWRVGAIVPDVTGVAYRTAITRLQTAGFVVQQNWIAADDPTESGRVLAQSPGGGEVFIRGGQVTIGVGQTEKLG
jgi:beta-lactam-binding protein with PASTA domain